MSLEDLWVAAYDPVVRRHMEHPTGTLADGFVEVRDRASGEKTEMGVDIVANHVTALAKG